MTGVRNVKLIALQHILLLPKIKSLGDTEIKQWMSNITTIFQILLKKILENLFRFFSTILLKCSATKGKSKKEKRKTIIHSRWSTMYNAIILDSSGIGCTCFCVFRKHKPNQRNTQHCILERLANKGEAGTSCKNKDCAPRQDSCDLTSNCETVCSSRIWRLLNSERCRKKSS